MIDDQKLQAMEQGMAELETWFQLDRSNPETYHFPVLGFGDVAYDGEAAFYLYRDFFAVLLEEVRGQGDVLSAIVQLFNQAYASHEISTRAFAEEQFQLDSRSVEQWRNIFGNPYWTGLTHETLSLYARKYEVEWPLRWLACLVDILATGSFDSTLAHHRDRRGRLIKGALISHISGRLAAYPEAKSAFDNAYSPPLRNLVGHNDYRIADQLVEALDGSVRETADEVWGRFVSMQAIHNGLLWMHFRYRQLNRPPPPHAGVVLVGWKPLTEGEEPTTFVGQLMPFRELDEDASWLDGATILMEGEKMMTRFGNARLRGGQLFPNLEPVLRAIRETGRLRVVVLPVLPCIHTDDFEHWTFDTPGGRYCVVGAPVVREVSAQVEF